jgi:hypothetical protein
MSAAFPGQGWKSLIITVIGDNGSRTRLREWHANNPERPAEVEAELHVVIGWHAERDSQNEYGAAKPIHAEPRAKLADGLQAPGGTISVRSHGLFKNELTLSKSLLKSLRASWDRSHPGQQSAEQQTRELGTDGAPSL